MSFGTVSFLLKTSVNEYRQIRTIARTATNPITIPERIGIILFFSVVLLVSSGAGCGLSITRVSLELAMGTVTGAVLSTNFVGSLSTK